jgi:lipopolysaccharide transport protein LptA
MAASSHNNSAGNGRQLLFALLALSGLTAPVLAQEEFISRDPNAPIIINAESSEFDYASNKVVFHGLRLYQGSFGIKANHAETDKLDFEDGVWVFTGDVVFETDSTVLQCDVAELTFKRHVLTMADMTGSPAWFEQSAAENGEENTVNSGEAISIVYKLAEGMLELKNQASFTDGKNKVAGDLITYDLQARHLRAGAGDSGPVKIIIEPPKQNKEDK